MGNVATRREVQTVQHKAKILHGLVFGGGCSGCSADAVIQDGLCATCIIDAETKLRMVASKARNHGHACSACEGAGWIQGWFQLEACADCMGTGAHIMTMGLVRVIWTAVKNTSAKGLQDKQENEQEIAWQRARHYEVEDTAYMDNAEADLRRKEYQDRV